MKHLPPRGSAIPLLLLAAAGLTGLGPTPARGQTAPAAPGEPMRRLESRPAADLAADPRLRRRVNEEQIGGSLARCLEAMADVTGVELTVADPFGTRAVTLLNTDLELARLMKALSRAYHLSWFREAGPAGGYSLGESETDRKKRREARETEQRRAAQQMQARWEQVRRLTMAPLAQVISPCTWRWTCWARTSNTNGSSSTGC